MRIAVNCRCIMSSQRTGIGRYTYHLLDQLGKLDDNDRFVLYARKRPFDVKRRLPSFGYPNFAPRIDYFGLGPGRVDVYHVPCPDRIGNTGAKVVVTIHDLIYKTYPSAHTASAIELTHAHMQEISRRADRIICASHNTRQDLHRFFNISQDKTCTILNGVDHAVFYRLVERADQAAAQAYLKTLGLEPGFILFVGTIEPRKNLQGLLQAMAQLKSRVNKVPKLVVAGMRGWMTGQILPLVRELGLSEDVAFTGFISDQQLNILYNSCRVFVFPSFYEGFGFPIVEAFCAGAAVVASNASSCPEIAADAALLVDPNQPQQISRAIERVLSEANLARELRRKALARAQDFSFQKTARQTLEVYRDL